MILFLMLIIMEILAPLSTIGIVLIICILISTFYIRGNINDKIEDIKKQANIISGIDQDFKIRYSAKPLVS